MKIVRCCSSRLVFGRDPMLLFLFLLLVLVLELAVELNRTERIRPLVLAKGRKEWGGTESYGSGGRNHKQHRAPQRMYSTKRPTDAHLHKTKILILESRNKKSRSTARVTAQEATQFQAILVPSKRNVALRTVVSCAATRRAPRSGPPAPSSGPAPW